MFRTGDTVRFDPDSFNPGFWNGLSYMEKLDYYGKYYPSDIIYAEVDPDGCYVGIDPFENLKPKLFTFMCEHHPQTGHCVLMDMYAGKLLPMCHTNDFILVEEDEC